MSNQKKKSKDGPELNERDAECLTYQAFKHAKEFLPQTPEEVKAAEAEFDEERVELPQSLRDPLAVLDRKAKTCVVLRFPAQPDLAAAENLACAAKNGKDIPPDVLAQMELDEARVDAERGVGDAHE